MDENALSESVLRRGWRDTKDWALGFKFLVADLGGAAVLGLISQNPWVAVIYVMGLFVVLWIAATASAPIRQRNELRRAIMDKDGLLLSETHLQNTVIVVSGSVERKSLKPGGAFVEFIFYVFNGSGLTVEIVDDLAGRIKLHSPILEPLPEYVQKNSDWFLSTTCKSLKYGQRGTIVIRQYLLDDLLERELTFANSPEVRQIDNMFGPSGPPIGFLFDEIQVKAVATKGGLKQSFHILLPLVSVPIES